MIFDFDDFGIDNNRLDLLTALHDMRPDFSATVFAVPDWCDDAFCASLPDWLTLAVHGKNHQTTYECLSWNQGDIEAVFRSTIVGRYFAPVFKAPGWQISDSCYIYCQREGIVVADQRYNAHRWPNGLRVYLYEGFDDRWHGHIQDVCGNGLSETFETVKAAVLDADGFSSVLAAAVLADDVR